VAYQDELVSNLKNVVLNLSNLTKAIQTVFPQIVGTSTTASAGSATLPSNPAGFIEVTLNGVTVKVPFYNQ
jgi:hypothetical protein